MADNILVTEGADKTVAADDIGGVLFQRVKLVLGIDGTNDGDLSSANPLPITSSTLATSAKQDTIIGYIDGVEGLLTTIDADTGNVATSTASIDTKTPSLGQALAAASVPVVLTAAQITTLTPLATVAVTQSGTWDEVGINDSGNSITVDQPTGTNLHTVIDSGTITLPSGASTLAEQQTQTTHLATIAGDTTDIYTLLGTINTTQTDASQTAQIVDDGGNPVTVTEGDSVPSPILGFVPMWNNGGDVAATGDETPLPVTLQDISPDSVLSVNMTAIDGNTPDMGNGAVGSGTQRVTLASDSTGVIATLGTITNVVHVDDNSSSLTVDYATTGHGTATGALRVELPTDGTGIVGLAAGTNGIGKLTSNSGVTIGAVELAAAQTLATVTTVSTLSAISAGSNLIADVGIQPRTTNGFDTFMASGSDGSSILVATAQAVKASAGKVYGYYLYNPEAAVTFVHFYNTAQGSVTVGTTNPLFSLQIPAGSAANLMSDIGITFGTAITIAATTTAGGNTAPATGVSATIFYK